VQYCMHIGQSGYENSGKLVDLGNQGKLL
jgi:hypothetical protein